MQTIKGKLIAGFSLVLALTLAVGAIGYYQIQSVSQKNERMLVNELEFSRAAINLKRLVLLHRRYEKDFILNTGDFATQDKYMKRFDEAGVQLRKEVHLLRNLADKIPSVTDAERTALDNILGHYERYYSTFRKKAMMIQARMMEASQANRELQEAKGYIHSIEQIIQDSHLGEQEVGSAVEEILDSSSLARMELAILTFSALVMGLLVSYFIFRSVENPILAMIRYADGVSSGNWNTEATVPDHGEMGRLKKAVQTMVGEMKKRLGITDGILKGMTNPCLVVDREERLTFINQPYLDVFERQGEAEDFLGMTMAELFYGDATRSTITSRAMAERIPIVGNEIETMLPSGKHLFVQFDVAPLHDLDGELVGAFAVINDLTSIKTTLQQIEEKNETIENAAARADHVSDQVAAAAEQLSAQMEQSGQGAERQRENATSTAAAMEEMNATVLEVARNAAGASEMADQSRERAQEGAQVVEQAVKTIRQVHELATELNVNMNELGTQAEGITRIMNVITDIADQTNLLALNAAIEAARAGDAGRGFAVVADEVRKLAEKTMQATKEVGESITAIQHSARKNITGTEQAAEAIDRSTEFADRSGVALSEIVSLVEQTADQVRNIATAAEQQSSASEEVTRATEDTSQIAQEMAQAMKESNRATADLSSLAQELKIVIEDMQR